MKTSPRPDNRDGKRELFLHTKELSFPKEKLEYYRRIFYKHCISRPGGCVEFVCRQSSKGESKFKFLKYSTSCRKAAWIFAFGIESIPDNKVVLRKCKTRNCVNIDHLFLSNCSDKFQHMKDKMLRNSTHLTEEDVKEIRVSTLKGVELAKLYDCSTTLISFIKNRVRNWSWVT